MANIAKWLCEAEVKFGEPILSIVVGKHDNRPWRDDLKPDENVLLTRETGLKKLDLEFDCGYGGADCYPIWAWTRSRVFFIMEYDGSTGLAWVPRNAQNGTPQFSGQQD